MVNLPRLRMALRRPYGGAARFRSRARIRGFGAVAAIAAGALVLGLTVRVATSPWPVGTTLRHIVAAPSCTAARAVGLGSARTGAPGYYRKHDRDRDGIACETYAASRHGGTRTSSSRPGAWRRPP